MPAQPTSLELWARVQILLNLDRVGEATALATQIVEAREWHEDDVLVLGRAVVFSTDDMPTGWAYFHPVRQVAVLATEVVDEFSLATSMFDFCVAGERMSEPGFRRYDVATWRELEASYDAEAGVDDDVVDDDDDEWDWS